MAWRWGGKGISEWCNNQQTIMRAWRVEGTHMKAWVCLLWVSKLYKLQNQRLMWKNEGTGRRGTVHDIWPNLVISEPPSRTSATQQSTNILKHTAVFFSVVESSYLWWGSQNGAMRVEIWRWKLAPSEWKMLDCEKTQQHTAKSRLASHGGRLVEGTDMSISLIWGQGCTIHLFLQKIWGYGNGGQYHDIGPYLGI